MRKTLKTKKKVTMLVLTALMMIGTVIPASAATATFTFTHSGNTYGITTTATNFSSYVTAWSKVTNKNDGTYKYSSNRGYKNAYATAKKIISNAKYVVRTGAAYSN